MSIQVTEEIAKLIEVSDTELVIVREEVVESLEVGVSGPQGIQGSTGAQGPQGPQGTPGAATGSYQHTQSVPSSTWTIVHNLGMYPNVIVIDTLGRVVEGDVAYPNVNTVVLTFSASFSGVANLS